MFDTNEVEEKVILVAVDVDDGSDVESSLDELEELSQTAGAVCVGRLIQSRDRIHVATYIGKGKVEELRELVHIWGADTVICDDELSPAQLGNLQDELGCKVIDRTVLILDIFAAHAATNEGKLQVELAQLRYRASRLTGLGKSLSRIGGSAAGGGVGGIGTRGPGEKKLEMDRRLIHDRISFINKQLKSVVSNRDTMRKQREKGSIQTVAIVGYTNAGKSTLLNKLTDASVLEEDMLFATLDPTTRQYEYENGKKILMTDTVGFINKLPHQLIRAFRSTLEEAKYADLILHVVDASNPNYETQMDVVYDTLDELEVRNKPIVTVFNKMDAEISEKPRKDTRSESSHYISAKQGFGLDEMLDGIREILDQSYIEIEKVFDYSDAGKIQVIRKYGNLEIEEYREDGIFVKGTLPSEYESYCLGR
ncbi:MAG: GTPase HflX [Eubacterium sp.]|nr:GTPase HflX [Eubacterium sp.]